MTFLLPAELGADATRDLERACVAGGPDNMPWPTEVRVEPGRLLVRRTVDESGYLVVPWAINGAGRLMGATATLMEREPPYQVQLELARGKVNQLRCQAADWLSGGLQMPAPLDEQIRSASHAFGRAVTEETSDQAGPQAQTALELGYDAAARLVHAYMEQVFQVRHQRQPRLDTALGYRLGAAILDEKTAGVLSPAANSVCVPFPWSAIEPSEGSYRWDMQDALLDWATAQGLPVTAGPLIDFSSAQLPDWLWLWERDLATLAKFMGNYVTTTIRRYRRRIRTWHLTAASNCAAVLSLGEDELLWLTVRLAETARQVDPALELVIGISQPWGEYMALEDRIHSPFIFADTLIRSGLNLAGLDLELAMGVTPRGSYCRDLLETSRLLDLYALLGVPLRVTLAYPAATGSDPKADPELRVAAGHWRGGFNPDAQAEWAAAFTSLALCKPYVQAVHWAHLSDADPHQFPHGGLVDAHGNPRPVVQRLHELREKHLR
jgi:hypothetical protein